MNVGCGGLLQDFGDKIEPQNRRFGPIQHNIDMVRTPDFRKSVNPHNFFWFCAFLNPTTVLDTQKHMQCGNWGQM